MSDAMMPGSAMVLEMAGSAMNAMVMDTMMKGPSLGGRMRADNNDSGNQSSNDFQFHYDVFPSCYDRAATYSNLCPQCERTYP